MNILVTGSNGQLGSEIKDLVTNYKDFNFFFRDLPELNICDAEALNTFIFNRCFADSNLSSSCNVTRYTSC